MQKVWCGSVSVGLNQTEMKLIVTPSRIINVRFKTAHGMKEISTHTRNMAEAHKFCGEAQIKKMELAAKLGLLTQNAVAMFLFGSNKVTLGSLRVQWVEWMRTSSSFSKATARNYNTYVNAWQNFSMITGNAPTDISEESIKAFVNRPEGGKASTRKIALAAIQSFIVWLTVKGYRAGNPAQLVRVDLSQLSHEQKEGKVREPFTDEEIERVISKADHIWRLIILLARHTGLRLSDTVQLEWASVKDGHIIRWTEKRDKRVSVPMNDVLLAEFLKADKEDDVYVFPRQRLQYQDASGRVALTMFFKRLCVKAGVVGKSFHNFRHTRATELYNEGGIEAVKEQLGHSSAKTSEGYIHATNQSHVGKTPAGASGIPEVKQ